MPVSALLIALETLSVTAAPVVVITKFLSYEKMVADEKHISKLAGDMKYDKEHHGPAKALVGDQHELPEHLQKAILDAPGKHCFGPAKYAHESPSKRYCIK